MISKPRSCSERCDPGRRGLVAVGDRDEHRAGRGSFAPAAACALANAVGKSRAIPITSPVERISGPSSESAPANRSNGSTASLTQTWPLRRVLRAARVPPSRSPSMTRHASLASGSPIALETNGTVREARGFASITCRPSSPWIANWTLSSPTTPSARAIPRRLVRGSARASPRPARAAAVRTRSRPSGSPPPRRAA